MSASKVTKLELLVKQFVINLRSEEMSSIIYTIHFLNKNVA